jgi:hypothetical protein
MPTSPPFVLALPAGARVAAFAEGCRAAALDFVNRVAASGDKTVLADWLRGPYRAHVVVLARSRTRRIGAASVVPDALARLLGRARLEVGLGLMRVRDAADGVGFGYSALAAGHVYRCQDGEGTAGWVPVAQPRMRLSERVLSLVAADYLLRPEAYETSLVTCSVCGRASFDADRVVAGTCGSHDHDDRPGERPPLQSDIRELSGPHADGRHGSPERAAG